MSRGCDPDDWPEPPTHPWDAPELVVDGRCEISHALVLDVSAEALEADEKQRADRAWDRTGFGFRP